ncbi:MAG: alpha/beta fold hydrolase [Patescibacteria group bacterium]
MKSMEERVELITIDGVKISGIHYKIESPGAGILLLHMMPAAKESWRGFAAKLNEVGIGALAVDLRGHGESDGGPDGYRTFTDEEHQLSIEDVKTGLKFQNEEGHSPLFVAGASIGANLALNILAEDPEIEGAILLSAGINYRGVQTLPAAKKIRPDQSVYVIAAKDDESKHGNCGELAEDIFKALATDKKKLEVFDVGGHGTNIFWKHPDLMDRLVRWLQELI